MSTPNHLSFSQLFSLLGGFFVIFLFLWLVFFLANPFLAYLIIFGCLFLVFIFTKPLYGLFLLIIFRPTLDIFTAQTILHFGNYSLNIASFLAVAAIGFSLFIILNNFSRFKFIPLKTPLLFFLLVVFASIFYSAEKSASIAEGLRLLSIFFLYAAGFILIKNKPDFKKLLYAVIFSIIIPGIIAFYQFFTQTGMTILDEEISNRIFGTFAHPNLFAYYLTIPLALSIFLILNKKDYQIKSNFLYLVASLIFILLTLTYTRGAWVVFLIIIFILGIAHYRKFLTVALLALFLIYLIIPPLHIRVNNLFQYNPYSSISWRINLWKDSLKYSQEKIIAGYGLGTANKIILEKRGEKFGSPDPHNDYLKILIENGIWGVVAYIFVISSLLLNLVWGYLKSNSIFNKNIFILFIGLSVALYFMSFADNVLRNTALQWVFWILLGALFSIQQKSSLLIKK